MTHHGGCRRMTVGIVFDVSRPGGSLGTVANRRAHPTNQSAPPAPLGSLSDLRRQYVERAEPLPLPMERALRTDGRRGAIQILEAVERRRRRNRVEGQRLRHLLRYENALWADGVEHVAGVDEAGMSPLAGPVVAGAVILEHGWREEGVDDSKKLKVEVRERLAEVIKRHAIAWAVGLVDPREIERINIYHAGLLAMQRAVENLATRPDHLLIDARRLKNLTIPQQGIVKGDAVSLTIAAASIIAKTTRDRIMVNYDREFPGYGFARHKGYPVREHYAALAQLGACPIHRRCFEPVRAVLNESAQTELFADATT